MSSSISVAGIQVTLQPSRPLSSDEVWVWLKVSPCVRATLPYLHPDAIVAFDIELPANFRQRPTGITELPHVRFG